MQLKCSECGTSIKVDPKKVVTDSSGTYIECPTCHVDIEFPDERAAPGIKSIKWTYKVMQLDDIFKPGLGKILHGDTLSFHTDRIESILEVEGRRGWELVEVVPTIGATGTASKLLLFFKKPIS